MNDTYAGGEGSPELPEGSDPQDVLGLGDEGSVAGMGDAGQGLPDDGAGTGDGKPYRKIAIIGTAEPHWRSSPFDDESWEIWTCGGVYSVAPRITRHFEIHDKAETCKGWGDPATEAAQRNVYWSWIAQQGPKVFLKDVLPETPNATAFPIEALCQLFPDKYFTSSISYMIALAIAEGVDEIGLWGIDMALTGDGEADEYGRQRPSVEYYLGIAAGQGIHVHLPPETTLLRSRKLYGFDGPVEDGFNKAAMAKIQELTARQTELENFIKLREAEIEKARRDLTGARWAIEVAQYFHRNMEL